MMNSRDSLDRKMTYDSDNMQAGAQVLDEHESIETAYNEFYKRMDSFKARTLFILRSQRA